MGLSEELSPGFLDIDSFDIDSFFLETGTSAAPNSQIDGCSSLDGLKNHSDYFKEIQSLIDHPPTPTPTSTPCLSSSPALRRQITNDEPSGPCFTREDQLHSTSRSELGGVEGYDFSKQVLLLECASALTQGDPIGSSTQSLPALTNVARKQKGRKLSLDKQRTTRQTIGVEDLQKHFGKKRAEAAKCLDVSVSKLKRISRTRGIARWPFNKSKNRAMSAKVVDLSLLSPTSSSYVVVDPISSMLPESEISSPPKQLCTEMATEKEEKPMTVKVQYRDDCVKFEIFSASKADLEEEISKRLKLKVGCFNIKYLDEEQDWISITCDVDLHFCIRIETSFHLIELKEG